MTKSVGMKTCMYPDGTVLCLHCVTILQLGLVCYM
jgi:hypothetical protein